MAVLVILSGLPGVGKSTVSRLLAQTSGALWLRLDAIEQEMRQSHMVWSDLADGGYAAARAVARGALAQGYDVIADSVNPIALTRADWAAVSPCRLEVEIICSDQAQHRQRVETRQTDVDGLPLPDWAAVQARTYEPWQTADVRLDSAAQSARAMASVIAGHMDRLRSAQ